MINQRFILPASIAAAIHAALLLALPGESWVARGRLIEVPLPPWPKPPDAVTVPPEDHGEKSTEPVKALGGSTPPEAPEPVALSKPDGILIPEPDRPLYPKKNITAIPATVGFDNGDGKLPWGTGVGGLFDVGKLDRVPSARVQIAPDYPAALRHSGTTGYVKVEFDVDPTGRVTEARVIESSHREFEEPTLRAVRKWQFEPGKRNGKAVPFRMAVPVEFGIDDR